MKRIGSIEQKVALINEVENHGLVDAYPLERSGNREYL